MERQHPPVRPKLPKSVNQPPQSTCHHRAPPPPLSALPWSRTGQQSVCWKYNISFPLPNRRHVTAALPHRVLGSSVTPTVATKFPQLVTCHFPPQHSTGHNSQQPQCTDLEPKSSNWAGSAWLGDKVKIHAWLDLGSKKF